MLENSEEQPAPVRVVSEIIKEYIDALGPIWIEGELSQINSRKDFTYMVLRDSSVDMSISLACLPEFSQSRKWAKMHESKFLQSLLGIPKMVRSHSGSAKLKRSESESY